MLTLLLVAGGLAAMFCGSLLLGLALARAVRHGEEQDRQTRHTNPHAAYWGRDSRALVPIAHDKPAHSRTRPRHRRSR